MLGRCFSKEPACPMSRKLTTPKGRVVGFMDIGTNSMRLLVVRIDPGGAYSVLTHQREPVRLGEGEFATRKITPEAMGRAVLVTARFADMARSLGAEQTLAVATSATREATNKRSFLTRLREASGVDVRVISGREEARLIYLGVASGANLNGDKALFIDIGGGSTELIVGDQQQVDFLDSLRLGAIRLTNLFMLSDDTGPVPPKRYELICQHVRTEAVRPFQRLCKLPIQRMIGSSGTITTLVEVGVRRFHGRAPQKSDELTHDQLREVIENLASLPQDQRAKVPGMNAKRADIIIAGAAILDTVMDELKIEKVSASDRTLRDGMLLDYMTRHGLDAGISELSYRMRSVMRLGRRCRFDEDHARHVAHLALRLFDTTRDAGLHELGDDERELLEYAALLHDIGTFLSHSNHRSHTYYFIHNADLLGFDETELAVIATTAMYHKKRYPRERDSKFAALDKPVQRVVLVLCTLLRFAESLDRSHNAAVKDAGVVKSESGVLSLQLNTDRDCHLELWAVQEHLKAFRRTFGDDLQIPPVEQPIHA